MSIPNWQQLMLRWVISKVEYSGTITKIQGYSAPDQEMASLKTTIEKMTLEEATKRDLLKCDEAHTIVIVDPERCYSIDVMMTYLRDSPENREMYERAMSELHVDAFEVIYKNLISDKYYLGFPALVSMTWLGMITTNI